MWSESAQNYPDDPKNAQNQVIWSNLNPFQWYEVPGHFWREDGELGQNLQKWPLCTYKVENQENQLIMLKNGPCELNAI